MFDEIGNAQSGQVSLENPLTVHWLSHEGHTPL